MSGPATPFVPSSARASQPPTGAATPSLPPQPTAPAMPAPAEFDIIPDLHKLLTRLTATPSLPLPASTPGAATKDANGPLEMKELAGEANAIKRKIQRARDKVMQLPDIERGLEDQEEEIEELEARIQKLKGALRELAKVSEEGGNGQVEGDSSMVG